LLSIHYPTHLQLAYPQEQTHSQAYPQAHPQEQTHSQAHPQAHPHPHH